MLRSRRFKYVTQFNYSTSGNKEFVHLGSFFTIEQKILIST